MSPNKGNPKAKKKKYLWLGYSSYSQLGKQVYSTLETSVPTREYLTNYW